MTTNQWLVDHEAYADALSEYRELRAEIEKAIGIKKKSDDQGGAMIGDVVEGYLAHLPLYGLLNRFEEAVIKKTRAKDKL